MKAFSDFRITGTNVFSAASALLYRRPLKFVNDFFSKRNLAAIAAQFVNPSHSNEVKAMSAALGVFIGMLPIWGVQTLLAVFLSVVLKLNKTLVLVFSLVSIPPFMPLIIFLSYRIGHFWITSNGITDYILGSLTLAVVGSVVAGILTYAGLKITALLRRSQLNAV